MYNGILVTDTLTTLGAEKIYTFVDGNCVARPIIADSRALNERETKAEKIVTEVNQMKMNLSADNLEQIEKDIIKKET